jgi:hypothetical protein
MSARELRALGVQQQQQQQISVLPDPCASSSRLLRSAARSREETGPASCAATLVLQDKNMRLLIQGFTVYDSKWHDGDVVNGGWKLAHLCKLSFKDRLSLIGDLRQWTVDDMKHYLAARMQHILHRRMPSPAASYKERNKFLFDLSQIVVQVKQWLKCHRATIKLADDEDFFKSLRTVSMQVHELMLLIGDRRDCMQLAPMLKASDEELGYILVVTVQTNVLHTQMQHAKAKYEKVLADTISWFRTLIEADVSSLLARAASCWVCSASLLLIVCV